MRKETNEPLRKDDELDLGVLLSFIVTVVKRIIQFIIDFFRVLAYGMINFLFFIRKSAIILVILLLLSLAAAWFVRSQFGVRYQASMAIRIQPDVAEALYGQANYLSELLSHGQASAAAAVLGIPAEEAGRLTQISVEPIINELTELDLYKNHIQPGARASRDTLLRSQVNFSEFRKNLKERDYPLQQITFYSNTAELPGDLQNKFLASLFSESLKSQEAESIRAKQQQVAGLTSARAGMDSMANALQENLRKDNAGSGGTDILMKGAEKTAETEIYEKMINLDAELYDVKTSAAKSGNFLNPVSKLPSKAVKTSIANQYFFRYFWIVFGIGFSFLLLLNLLKVLPVWERNLRSEKSA